MLDITTAHPRRVRPLHPSTTARPQAAPAPVTADDAREGRIRALAAKAARRAAAFQPVENILIDPAFRARIEALAARRGGTLVSARPVTTARPLAAG